jgi:hypothetical protein
MRRSTSVGVNAVLDALNRGDGSRALAYYERVAAEAEQKGDRVLAARAGDAAASA